MRLASSRWPAPQDRATSAVVPTPDGHEQCLQRKKYALPCSDRRDCRCSHAAHEFGLHHGNHVKHEVCHDGRHGQLPNRGALVL